MDKIERLAELRKKYPRLEFYYEITGYLSIICLTNSNIDEAFQKLEELLKEDNEQISELIRN